MLAATAALLGAFAGYVILGQFTGGLVAVVLGAVLAAGGIVVLARSQVGTQAEAMVRSGSYDVGLWVALGATVTAAALLVWAIHTAPAFRARVARELDPGEPTA